MMKLAKQSVLTVDPPTYELIKSLASARELPMRGVVEEIALILSVLVDDKHNNNNLREQLKVILMKAPTMSKSVGEQRKTVSLRTNMHQVIRHVKSVYGLTYNQLINAMVPLYIKTYNATNEEQAKRLAAILDTVIVPESTKRAILEQQHRDAIQVLHDIEDRLVNSTDDAVRAVLKDIYHINNVIFAERINAVKQDFM